MLTKFSGINQLVLHNYPFLCHMGHLLVIFKHFCIFGPKVPNFGKNCHFCIKIKIVENIQYRSKIVKLCNFFTMLIMFLSKSP